MLNIRKKLLQNARNKKGLTQQQLADVLQIKLRSYQRYEYGERNISLETAGKLAEILGIDLYDLVGRNSTTESDKTETA